MTRMLQCDNQSEASGYYWSGFMWVTTPPLGHVMGTASDFRKEVDYSLVQAPPLCQNNPLKSLIKSV